MKVELRVKVKMANGSRSHISDAELGKQLLKKQLADLNKNPVEGFSAGLINDSDFFKWEVRVLTLLHDSLVINGFLFLVLICTVRNCIYIIISTFIWLSDTYHWSCRYSFWRGLLQMSFNISKRVSTKTTKNESY